MAGSKKAKHKKGPPARRTQPGRSPAKAGAAGSPGQGRAAGSPTKAAPGAGGPQAGPGAGRSPARAGAAEGGAGEGGRSAGRGPERRTRGERLAAARRARARKRRLVQAAVAAVLAAVLVGVVLQVVSSRRERRAAVAGLTAGSCRYDTRSDPTDPQGDNHVPAPTYRVDPPAGGNHLERAAAPGTYGPGTVPPDGQVVHAMEHGYVVLWYRPGPGSEPPAVVRRVAERHRGEVLVVPRATLAGEAAATAWGRRLLCRDVEEAPLDQFVRRFLDKAPERGFVRPR